MTDPEFDTAFHKIVCDLDLRKDGMYELKSLETLRERLFTCLVDHIIALGFVDVNDQTAYELACQQLTTLMNDDFERMDGELARGDEVVSVSGTLYTLIDNSAGSTTTHRLPGGSHLRGRVLAVIVTDIPDANRVTAIDEDHDGGTPVPLQRFGLGILLPSCVIDDDHNSMEITEKDLWLCVPIYSYQPMPLKKVVESDERRAGQ